MAKKTNYPKTMYISMTEPSTTRQYGKGEAFESPVQFEGEPLACHRSFVGKYKFVQAGRIECSSKFVPGEK